MKNFAKIFIWIGMIFHCLLIYPVAVGVIALQKLNDARKKEDIQTISILTLLFCNMVAGIVMLTMTDKDLYENNTKAANIYPKQNMHNDYTLLHKILSIVILGIVLLSYLFSMVPLINFGDAFIPFILTNVLIVASIVLIIMAHSKKKNNKICSFISLIIIAFSFAVIVLSILHCCGLALIDGNYYDMPNIDILVGCIICSVIIIVMASIMFFTLINDNEETVISVEEKITTTLSYGIEDELEEVKSMFEKGLFNEQDYNLAKQKIMNKYYN